MRDYGSKATWPGWVTTGLIGNGSFGAVYEIRRDVMGETERAALKMISIPRSLSEIEELRCQGYNDQSISERYHSYLKMFVSEYTLMRKMNGSANVVNCDDVRYEQHPDGIGWDIYIRMELLTPLLAALPEHVPEKQAVAIGRDISRALVLCRRYNIIHRDIKPQNIFVSPIGDYKLGDFGIAKTAERTSGGTRIGTYNYMAPEVFNNQPYGMTADICSLGLVMYWLLNEKRLPFLPISSEMPKPEEEEEARARRFRGEQLPPPRHGSPELKRIVLKACTFNPLFRYQTADELLEDLEKLEKRSIEDERAREEWERRRREEAINRQNEGKSSGAMTAVLIAFILLMIALIIYMLSDYFGSDNYSFRASRIPSEPISAAAMALPEAECPLGLSMTDEDADAAARF